MNEEGERHTKKLSDEVRLYDELHTVPPYIGAATGPSGPSIPTAPAATRDPATTKPLGNMVLPDLLKISQRLSQVRRYDLGAILSALGVGLIGAAISAVIADEPLKDLVLACLIAGVVAVVFGVLLSRDRSESIAAIRRDIDFDIDSWCRENPDLDELRERYREIAQAPSLWDSLPRGRKKD